MYRRLPHTLLVLLLLVTVGVGPALAQRDVSIMRVRLMEQVVPQTLVMRTADRGLQVYAGDLSNAIVELGPGEEATISVRETDVYVMTEEQAFFAASLRISPIQHGMLDVVATDVYGNTTTGRYPGRLLVQPEGMGLRLINHAPLEDYVASVVSHEYGFDDLEGNKAMATLARTYALRAAGTTDADYDLSDHTGAQIYRGSADLTPAALEAARKTAGEVLTYGGDLIEAVYFASSGGLTASNEAVWQSDPVPYLRSRPDPFDADAPYQAWESTIPRTRFLSILTDTYRSPVTGFLIHEQSDDGRVRTIRLLGPNERLIDGNTFRTLVNQHFGETRLRSTLFDARREGDTYVFEGRGFGHGVGLSQWGAHAMAEQGYDYRQILAQYYTGVMLQKDGRAMALPAPQNVSVQMASHPPDSPRQPTTVKRKTTKRRVGW